jgi:hypothetical protein
MHRRPYFKMRYGAYLKSEHGIKKFAEMAMGHLIRNVTKKSAFYREMNENLLVEKANLRMRAEELFEQPMLSAGEFFSVRRRLWANNFIITAVVLASIFMIFASVSAFMQEDSGMGGFLQWMVSIILASVLTGGGLIVTARVVESLIPPRRHETEEIGRPVAILWAILFVGIELAILGITEVQAKTLSTAQNSGVLYTGFIAFAMMLPVIAGMIRWDAMRFIDAYKTTRAHREIDSRLAQIDSILRQNEEYESNFYKIRSIEHWDLINEFRTYKDLYNERIGIVEQLSGHFAQTYDAYQREAYKRYESDLRDMNATSMRRLEIAGEIQAGRKIGQINSGLRPGASAMGGVDQRNGDGKLSESDIYLAPKPVR